MGRSKWPLYAVLTVTIIVLTGVVAWNMTIPAPLRAPYDMKELGLGTASTVVIAISTDCQTCEGAMEFYKSLMHLPEVDGKARRVVAVAMDGVVPLHEIVTPLGFKPHRLTSGPYMMRSLPGVSEPGTILLLDAEGRQIGKWAGALSDAQEREIIAAIRKT